MISKRRLLQIHRWAGLIAATVLLFQATTGVLLVFRFQFAELADPQGFTRSIGTHRSPISEVIDAARTRYPGYEFEHVGFPQTDRGVYVIHMLDSRGDSRWVSVDPVTGRVLRAGDIWSFPAEAAMQIHYRLLRGREGLAVMMASGLALVTLAVIGLLYWWPKSGGLRQSLAIGPRAPFSLLLRRLHRTVGVFTAVMALFSGVTGLTVAGDFMLAPGPLVPVRSPLVPVTGNLDAALSLAKSVYPDHGIRDIRSSPLGTFDVYFWAPEKSPDAVDEVSVNPRLGRIVSIAPARSAHALWMTMLSIHDGSSFGTGGEVILFTGGLAILGLAMSGPIVWLLARRAMRRRSPRREKLSVPS